MPVGDRGQKLVAGGVEPVPVQPSRVDPGGSGQLRQHRPLSLHLLLVTEAEPATARGERRREGGMHVGGVASPGRAGRGQIAGVHRLWSASTTQAANPRTATGTANRSGNAASDQPVRSPNRAMKRGRRLAALVAAARRRPEGGESGRQVLDRRAARQRHRCQVRRRHRTSLRTERPAASSWPVAASSASSALIARWYSVANQPLDGCR